ncbi:MAG: hypothetical protein M0P71_05105 [Melioribacteraceae bacterium]|nr:hypothetical protein [Melioribacteraceae bacterium]
MKKNGIITSSSQVSINAKVNNDTKEKTFFVVGIGASAGGLDAIEKLFINLNPSTGMAFIIVSHLDPKHKSIMPELIQKYTKMELFQAEDGMEIKPNHVYVAPANNEIGITNGKIELISPIESHGFRLPIDFFFKSLAKDFGEHSIGIILSGMASDGTEGIKAIKNELGMVIAQEVNSAKFDGMPSSAINSGFVDLILTPEEMPSQLINYTATKQTGLSPEQLSEEIFTNALQIIYSTLLSQTGHDFSHYKINTIQRRLERRMALSHIGTISQWFYRSFFLSR